MKTTPKISGITAGLAFAIHSLFNAFNPKLTPCSSLLVTHRRSQRILLQLRSPYKLTQTLKHCVRRLEASFFNQSIDILAATLIQDSNSFEATPVGYHFSAAIESASTRVNSPIDFPIWFAIEFDLETIFPTVVNAPPHYDKITRGWSVSKTRFALRIK